MAATSRSKIRSTAAVTCVLIVLVALAWYAWHTGPSSEAAGPAVVALTKTDFTARIREVGEVRALKSITARAEKDGPIAYLVPEGKTVVPGEVLVRFDSALQDAALAASRFEVEAADETLRGAVEDRHAGREKLMSEVARLRSEVELARVELTTLKRKPLPEEEEKARLEL